MRSLGPDVVESPRLPISLAEHSSNCLRCQAEASRYRKMKRELGALSAVSSSAPKRILSTVDNATAYGSQIELPKSSGKVVVTLAGATAAAASVVVVAMWRRSHAVA